MLEILLGLFILGSSIYAGWRSWKHRDTGGFGEGAATTYTNAVTYPMWHEGNTIPVDDNVFVWIAGSKRPEYQVILKSGVQYFHLTPMLDNRDEALWFASMLQHALDTITVERSRG